MTPTMAYARYRGVYLLLVHREDPPDDAEWARYLVDAEAWLPTTTAQIVLTDGGGPTSGQRRELRALWSRIGHPPCRTAVLTGSLFARGIVLAITLFRTRIRAFHRDDHAAAFAYVGAPADLHADLLAELARMRRGLDPRAA